MRTIAIVNQKGGCGKTTVSINLASALAEKNMRTLLVDMDPQSHCAVGLAVPEEQVEQSIYDVLISTSRNEPIRLSEILWQIGEKLDLAPASIDLSAFEQQMSGIAERERCLKTVLAEAENNYDFAIIDCPPAVGLLTFNALTAATEVVVPVETGYFALHGLSKQLETLSILCERCNHHVDVRVLASMYDIRTKMAREILSELRNHFGDKMFKTIINFNTKIKEAASFGQPVTEYDPASKGQKDFVSLAEEVMVSQTKQQQHKLANSLTERLEAISASAEQLLASSKLPAKLTTAVTGPSEPEKTAHLEPEKVEQPEPVVVEQPKPIEIEQPEPVEASQSESLEAEQLEPAEVAQPVPVEASQSEPVEVRQSASLEVEQPELEETEHVQGEQEQPMLGLDAKLSDYYGVNQISDAVVFVTLYPRADTVQIAGDFNNWQPSDTTMEKVGKSGVWQTKLNLPAGKYRYRLVVDGQWQQDPYNENNEINPFGELNSVLEVQ